MNRTTLNVTMSSTTPGYGGFPISGQELLYSFKLFISQYSRLLFYSESDAIKSGFPIQNLSFKANLMVLNH